MIDLAEAQRIVLESCPPAAPVTVGLDAAAGLVLADDVVAGEDVPPFANSAVDGYAVIAADVAEVPVELDVVAEVAAGRAPPDAPLERGAAIRIMTGAALPPGADAVVMVEDSERLDGGERVRLTASVPPGAGVRRPASDVAAGTTLFTAGTPITPAVLGVLASVNARELSVFPAARVAVLSTGDELVTDGSPLAPGQIRESNLTMLAPLLREAGCDVTSYGVIPDDEARLEAVLREAAAGHDAIVTSGGVSMGDYDVVKAVLGGEAGVEFLSLAMNPGKPLGFGMVGGRPFFGLPGNPVSVLVSFEQFARPALLAMQGANALLRPRVRGVAGETFTSDPAKEAFLRARIVDHATLEVVSTGGQGSNVLSGAAAADCFAVMPVGVDKVEPGDSLLLELFTAQENRGVGDE